MYTEPTVSDFKSYFVRDFPYGTDISLNVLDSDINKALIDADAVINQELFSTQTIFTIAFLNLAAHFMVMSLRASSQGISGQFSWLQNSKSVGSVSEGLMIPERISSNPEYAIYSKTNYGAKYLTIVLPLLSGAVVSVRGRTHA